jgi:hypothetical protein
MSKRNFILLIIVLIILVVGVLGYFYFNQPASPTGSDTGGTNFFSQFNPFGTSPNKPTTPVVTPPVDVSGYQPNPAEETKLKLTKVSSMPIAGFTVFMKERLKDVTPPQPLPQGEGQDTSSSTATTPIPIIKKTKTTKPVPPPTEFMPALRYVDRASGNVYQTFADKIEERKFSGTVIPQVYEAFFGNEGESVVMRYLKTDGKNIETFVGNLPKELLGADTTGSNEIKGSFLPNNVEDISLSPDTGSIFYLFSSGNNLSDSIVGTTLNLSNTKKVQIFDSPFTEWLSLWPNSKMITLTTKPSFSVPGYMYAIDPSKKNFTKVLGGINGLTTLTSPNGKLVLYGDNSLSLYVYHTDTKSSDILGVKTLPEKCIWSGGNDSVYCAVPKFISAGKYPDAWYQGVTSFSDQIWKVDIKTGTATMVLDPATINGGEEIDGTKLAMDAGENYLFFVNKKDSFLWEFALK